MIKKFVGAAVLVAAVSVTAFALNSVDSGLKVGDFVSAFHPTHVSGPFKGTDTCIPCTYGKMPQVQVWVNGDDEKNVEAIAKLLEKRVGNWQKSNLKPMVIFITDKANKSAVAKKIEAIAPRVGNNIALTYIDKDNEAIEQYAINTASSVKNTILVHKDMKVATKFVNLKADEKGLAELNTAVNNVTK